MYFDELKHVLGMTLKIYWDDLCSDGLRNPEDVFGWTKRMCSDDLENLFGRSRKCIQMTSKMYLDGPY
eukprot:10740040-Karenia_brevis.AAC.1